MNRKRYALALGSILAVLALASCGRTAAPESTVTSPPVLPSPTQEQSLPATDSPQQTETSPAPTATKVVPQISHGWRVAYFVEDPMQICAMDGDENDRSCLELNEDNFLAGYDVPSFLALSPDGAKVAYGTECSIYVWTIGRDVFPLRNDGVCGGFREAVWSSDGSSIAYISEELFRTCQPQTCQSYFGDIFVSSLDGTVHRALTGELDGWSHWPDWSPDGKNIVFSLGRASQFGPSGYTVNEDIAIIPAKGGSAVKLTYHSAADTRPKWSPDGSQIAFLSDRNGAGVMNLYLMNPEGGELSMAAKLGSPHHWPYSRAPFFWLPDSIHMIHGDRLIDTSTRQMEPVDLPVHSPEAYASWATSPQNDIVSSTPNPLHCAAGWSKLRPDILAVATGETSDPPNRVREAADTDATIIYQIYPGALVRVLEGPIGTDGLVFWKVENESIPGGAGWTAEGDMQEYFLEPVQ